jgi:hypothetical protein
VSVEELRLEDSYGRKLIVSQFAGQITITPVVLNIDGIGDTIALNDTQAHLLLLYLQEHRAR